MSDAAARREARRRRILENSEDRLRMISGVVNADDSGDSPANVHSVPPLGRIEITNYPTEPTSVADSASPNDTLESRPIRRESLTSHVEHDEAPAKPFVPFNKNQSDSTLQEIDESPSLITSCLAMRLHLVGLAVLVRLLFSTRYSSLFAESVFVPLFTVTLMKHFGVVPAPSNGQAGSGMLNAALILSGMPARQIGLLKNVMGAVTDFILDFYMYFFSFIVLHVLLECSIY
ncbi:hypothetical protein ONE63_002573 [Megalurothrips usitatus]|uniref:Calcium signal-modulating cyclophilin ligand n=1 Tax=Megalurothrips usitatus TaxID=439358 RepID=A0AAV7XCA8_9NEOP|nr:hypothetical protein ONE63_002573 [Megalurothrips usitatus]